MYIYIYIHIHIHIYIYTHIYIYIYTVIYLAIYLFANLLIYFLCYSKYSLQRCMVLRGCLLGRAAGSGFLAASGLCARLQGNKAETLWSFFSVEEGLGFKIWG